MVEAAAHVTAGAGSQRAMGAWPSRRTIVSAACVFEPGRDVSAEHDGGGGEVMTIDEVVGGVVFQSYLVGRARNCNRW